MCVEELMECLRLGVKAIDVKVLNFDVQKSHIVMTIRQYLCFFFSLLVPSVFFAQEKASQNEWTKIRYVLQTDIVASTGKYAPFWLVSNRHGLSSLENSNANLSVGVFRDFDEKKGFTWAYGAEFAGAWHYTSPFVVQQLYANVKYNCWDLCVGSKERWSEGKHSFLSGGGLTFAPNARPIPQVRFGINEYATVPWWFNGWVKVKGHFSYGRYTDNCFLQHFVANSASRYTTNLRFHEKTAFFRVVNPSGKGLGWESGLEMYTKFGGDLYTLGKDGEYVLSVSLPTTLREYIAAFIPLPGGESSPQGEQVNINGNVLGSWHAAMDYTAANWRLRAYYEHFFEDHSQLLGISWVSNREGVTRFLSYHPWIDGLWGLELELLRGKLIKGVVFEYITSRDQSGPILHNSNENFKEQISGFDYYYNHGLFLSWQHWGMAVCNPHFLSPVYNENGSLSMPNTRIRSYHIGVSGEPYQGLMYRIMTSYTRHWGSFVDPLVNPESVLALMLEVTYTPVILRNWQFVGTLANDYGNLIGNNVGGMLTIKKSGILK